MRVISVNVGTPQRIEEAGPGKEAVFSAIRKAPVKGPVAVRTLNLEGDRQADLTVHGGAERAVYLYPSEHYGYWKERFPGMDIPPGTFGENLTTEGLLEKTAHVGDRFAIGTAEFEVTKPRFPCFKLGTQFGTQAVVEQFLDSGRTGFFLKVLREGRLKAGDAIKATLTKGGSETIATVVRRAKKSK